MKHEWKKNEKGTYLPGPQPALIDIPAYRFFMIRGEGDPNDPSFGAYVEALYAASYGIKMTPKSGITPAGYFDYTVYPLEGVWDLSEEGRQQYKGTIRKADLVFTLMIRQPDFVTPEFAAEILDRVRKKKKNALLEQVTFGVFTEGLCVQMLHKGSYDSEPESFKKMEIFCEKQKLVRAVKTHREIYLSDARKVGPDQLKTILRIQVHS